MTQFGSQPAAFISAAPPSAPSVTLLDPSIESSGHWCLSDQRDDQWIDFLLSHPAERLVANVRTHWTLVRIGDVTLPTTINDAEYGNSYVCSPYTGCVLYPRSEIDKLNGHLLPLALRALLLAMGPPLRAGHINRVVCVNNWMLSTNLYPEIAPAFVPELTRLLVERFPSHAIAFRSLNEVTNRELIRELAEAGYLLAPSRQIYFFPGDSGEYVGKPNCRWDQKLLATTHYRLALHDELQALDAPRIEQLYRLLYIDKYSPHNPQFTAKFFQGCRQRRLLTMWGLRSEDGRLDGIVGSFERDGVMTVPVVGYDTSLPQKLGLYRLLMAIVLREAAQRKVLLNLSSGAAHFKRLRGGQPCLEYTAIYCRHLLRRRRAVWHALAWLLRNIGGPILHKYQL